LIFTKRKNANEAKVVVIGLGTIKKFITDIGGLLLNPLKSPLVGIL
jgi:hypothetical protein